GPLEVDLRDLGVLEDGDALFADVDRHEELALRLRQWRPARRLAATALLRPLALTALRLSLRARRLGRRFLLFLLGLCLGGGDGVGGRGSLRPPAPATTSATAARPGGAGLSRLDGGLWDYGLGCCNGSGSLDRRLLVTFLSASKPAQAKSPSCARAAATP